jgi:hypothetical protein
MKQINEKYGFINKNKCGTSLQLSHNKEDRNDSDYQLTKVVPLETSHPPMSWLKAYAYLNISLYHMNKMNEANK